ncbi:MAG: trans-aconitate 2-methyltransferase [Candidatus Kapaibacterium sp.]
MYHLSAKYYDHIYSFKDYEKESAILRGMVETYCRSNGNQLLDVACGTGNHIEYLREDFKIEGVDLEPEFLEIVREKFPELPFHLGDMRTFDLGREFDVVTCLFSAIGYMQNVEELNLAIANMARHLLSGGLLLVEPWFSPDKWRDGSVHMLTIDEPELKIARIVTSAVEGRMAVMDMHHLVGTPEKTEHFMETHRMFLATKEELMDAVKSAGLNPFWEDDGLTMRGMLIGVKE